MICSSKHCRPTSIDKSNIGANKEAELQTSASAQHLNPNAEVWVGSMGSFCPTSGEQVALQTALEKVGRGEKRKVRVLFDSGSQNTFIPAKVVDKLELKPLREGERGIKTFRKSELELKKRAVYQVMLVPVTCHSRSVAVEALAVDEFEL